MVFSNTCIPPYFLIDTAYKNLLTMLLVTDALKCIA
jgi:hypothetical protein